MKNRILFILCVVLLFTYAAGCAAPADTSPDDTVTAAPETEAETDDLLFRDDLPERDFEGFSFNLYTRENTTHYHFLVENQNGEVLNDAIFTRNSNVSERFNVEFTEVTYVDENLARTTIMAGDDSFSMMNVRCSASNVLASQGLVHSVNSLPYINLDKGYWDRELTEALTVGGKSYFAIGATNLSTYDFMSVLLFNKKLIDDFGLDSPYELVNSGKWTFDRFGEMGAAVTTDINGDGKYNASDTFGLLGVAKYTQVSLLTAADTMMIKMADGYPVFEMGSDARFISVFEKVFEITTDNNSWYKTSDGSNEGTPYVNMFRADQGLFLSTIFFYIEIMRDMETEFGIIPYPKYNEEQERYRNRITFYDTFVVPITEKDLERTSVIIEALTCESGKYVIPAYYDIALKTKYTRDNESQEMLDIIMANRVLDLGDTIFVGLIRDAWLSNMFINNNRDIVSTAEKNANNIIKNLETMIAAYDALEY